MFAVYLKGLADAYGGVQHSAYGSYPYGAEIMVAHNNHGHSEVIWSLTRYVPRLSRAKAIADASDAAYALSPRYDPASSPMRAIRLRKLRDLYALLYNEPRTRNPSGEYVL